MKSFLFLFCLTVLFSLNVSETNNFQIESGSVIWQKVFDTKLTKEPLIQQLKSSGYFYNVSDLGESITAEIKQLSMDFKGYGESEMTTPIYIARSFINAFILVEFKEERYRVTVKNIKLVQKYDDALSREGETTDLELYALKKRNTEFRPNFLNKPSEIMNFSFQKIVDFDAFSKKDNW